ncbi:MAG: cell wall-active antibiotics response protein [Bacteroidales bacterium]|nr:cell wall-active antibiotics response protein [Bacteroidales bacterium]
MEHKPTDKRLVAGIILIVAGIFLTAEVFDILTLNLRHYLISWKTLLIFIGLVFIFHREHYGTGIVLIVLGSIFWFNDIFELHLSFHKVFWPFLLIGLGIIFITRRPGHSPHNKHIHGYTHRGRNSSGDIFGSSRSDISNDYMDELAFFGGGQRTIVSQNFKGGKVTSIFGGSEFNLKNSVPAKEGCEIDVFTVFGGSKYIVPEDWKIQTEVVSIFGGFSDKRIVNPENQDPTKFLRIKGVVIFGGGEIKSF